MKTFQKLLPIVSFLLLSLSSVGYARTIVNTSIIDRPREGQPCFVLFISIDEVNDQGDTWHLMHGSVKLCPPSQGITPPASHNSDCPVIVRGDTCYITDAESKICFTEVLNNPDMKNLLDSALAVSVNPSNQNRPGSSMPASGPSLLMQEWEGTFYPNPVSIGKSINLSIPAVLKKQLQGAQIVVYNNNGKLVQQFRVPEGSSTVSINLPPAIGIYLIQLKTEDGKMLRQQKVSQE